MRWKFPAGALIALALFIPAAPAAAQAASPGLNAACQTVERKVYTDIRELVTIDLDTATTVQVRVLAAQILATANKESLPVLPDAIQDKLDGTSDELRAFLKSDVQNAWSVALRISVVQTLTDAGPNVKEAAQKVLDAPSIDTYLAYLNNGLYEARALDCASQPTPTPSATATPSATPSGTPTVAPTATPSVSSGAAGGNGGGLPVTGANTLTVAGLGAALLLLGGAGYVIGRRRRSRFVA
ncbi:LPXTG cell wall anchor domain-containing protein [Micromonospora tarensis]|uniref:LPXTG cell wall anchor domain-containing protein n=1 Tax=Micromonospora tarensis TaxID=2806100 RepID=A0ABS1YCH7_9ACTN|nr:LPXTG cell wall anchor domain-containing protein [Micromonospora tarensis]MBM0275068.1 LPXTG cell wall anchor domain-containing protein [Micromonospora tarensis]